MRRALLMKKAWMSFNGLDEDTRHRLAIASDFYL